MSKFFLIISILVLISGCTAQKCGIENCHGLDITCGPNIPEVCTTLY
ncbi:Uncharacterised protein [Candidatus Tiddalikarchaeum anstoanum]|nr:Uncharacterised protein [Candidatus Tiddalikarchaeum anstoanum]